MPNPSHQDINEELRQLQRDYIKKLPGRVTQLVEAWKRNLAQSEEETLQDIYRQAHTIAGTSGVLGIDEVSQAARAIEQLIKERENDGSLNSEEISAAQHSIDILHKLSTSSEIKIREINLQRR
ncbi:Hpt domain-containing protein [Spongiibacter marinus]|uniref:Hpt domain-containing protein n=1 Tax=Spongiibacter marinus TaxID=354246 RepID=UPI000414DA0E|nr:Hpt domain-containing protein [Spongiibacter marinus]